MVLSLWVSTSDGGGRQQSLWEEAQTRKPQACLLGGRTLDFISKTSFQRDPRLYFRKPIWLTFPSNMEALPEVETIPDVCISLGCQGARYQLGWSPEHAGKSLEGHGVVVRSRCHTTSE